MKTLNELLHDKEVYKEEVLVSLYRNEKFCQFEKIDLNDLPSCLFLILEAKVRKIEVDRFGTVHILIYAEDQNRTLKEFVMNEYWFLYSERANKDCDYFDSQYSED